MPAIYALAKRISNNKILAFDHDDIFQVGCIGILNAIKNFRQQEDVSFFSYAIICANGNMLTFSNRYRGVGSIPSNSKIKKNALFIVDKTDESIKFDDILKMILHNEYSVDINPDSVKILKDYINYYFNTPIRIDEFNEEIETSLIDTTINDITRLKEFLGDSVNTDILAVNNSLSIDINRVLLTISERERDIVKLYYGIGLKYGSSGLSLEEIGEKFDLTRNTVREIIAKSVRRLKHNSRSNCLKKYLG